MQLYSEFFFKSLIELFGNPATMLLQKSERKRQCDGDKQTEVCQLARLCEKKPNTVFMTSGEYVTTTDISD